MLTASSVELEPVVVASVDGSSVEVVVSFGDWFSLVEEDLVSVRKRSAVVTDEEVAVVDVVE